MVRVEWPWSQEWMSEEYEDEVEYGSESGFDLDPCATESNAKCDKFYTIENDGLQKDWRGARVFCNPPYGRELHRWVKKCYDESRKPNTLVVMLIPARTDTAYFHDYIYHKAREIRFVRGRLHFNESKQGHRSRAWW